jgi:hypothetical protein
MKPQRFGLVMFLAGAAVMAGDVVYGKLIQDEVARLGMSGLAAEQGQAGLGKLMLFAFSFPLGMGLSLLGAALFGGTAASRAGRLGGVALVLVLVPMFLPEVIGKQHSPRYFGYGGITIMVLVAAAIWFWGNYRLRLNDAKRVAADWQGLGYLAFALAAWNLCGFGSMPSFALYPEKMIALNAIPFAVGQLKSIMALFILGWAFTAIGLWRAQRTAV